MTRSRLIALAVASALIAGSACGGGGEKKDTADAGDPASVETPTSVVPSEPGGATTEAREGGEKPTSGSDRPAVGGGAPSTTPNSSGSGGSQETKERPKLVLDVTLASACVKAGEKQTITIKTAPDSAVGYNSYYADGKSGLDKENGFYGGNNGGPVPASGVWSDTWTISAAAPTGAVRVTIGGAHVDYEAANEERTFHVAGQGTSCP